MKRFYELFINVLMRQRVYVNTLLTNLKLICKLRNQNYIYHGDVALFAASLYSAQTQIVFRHITPPKKERRS